MKTFEEWMNEYGSSHRNHTNQIIHKICVPVIMFSVLGMLWTIPATVNIAGVFAIMSLIFYFKLSFKYAFGMLIQTSAMLGIISYMAQTTPLFSISLILFIVAWAGQFYGHKLEGKKPSFFKDLVFLLIGPLWVLRFLYKKVDI